MNRGFLHIYTGNGKGKTTAALGLALRAAGAGKKVLISQFLKQANQSEHKALAGLSDWITVHCYGSGPFIMDEITREDISAAKKGLNESEKMIKEGHFDMIILDEVIVAIHLGLIAEEKLIEIVDNRPMQMEIVLTGRDMPEKLKEKADLVTEMVEIKHYYRKGVRARPGIEM